MSGLKQKPPIGIADTNFGGTLPEVQLNNFRWVSDHTNCNVVVFTDNQIMNLAPSHRATHKIAWLIEPPVLISKMQSKSFYDFIINNHRIFDMIFTYDTRLLSLGNKFRYVPFGTTWIWPEHRKIYEKSKMTSIIASNKNITAGHKLRHQVIDKFRDRFDAVLGRKYQPFENKWDGLKDFRYSVVIENEMVDIFFTEKLMDCFMTGTVPIYWGTKGISEIFDTDGFIYFNNLDELENILDTITEDDYLARRRAIKNNFNIAMRYLRPENTMWENGLKEFENLCDYGVQY